MKIGIVNPYSWDVPGGVGFHIRDLALKLRSRGHDVRVLTPSTSDDLPEWITSAGSSVSIPFNGSVANISVKPTILKRTRRWLADNDFDVVHVHEPLVPGFHADVGVEGLQAQLGLFGLGESDFRFAVEHLPLEVGLAHGIVVNQPDGTHSGTGQVEGNGRPQSAHSHDEYAGLFQQELSCLADFVEQNLSVVA